jgi:hypothetical protein
MALAFPIWGGAPGDFKRMWPEVFDEARSSALAREPRE